MIQSTGFFFTIRSDLESSGIKGDTPVDNMKKDSSVSRVVGLGSGQ